MTVDSKLLALCFSLSIAGAVRASDRPITTLVPSEALVVYTALPFPTLAPPTSQPTGSQPASSPGFGSITGIISFLSASGLMPDEGQVFADIATALPLLGQFEHALVLLDVSSRAVENVGAAPDAATTLRLNRLQAAVIFRTDGRHGVVLDQLNRVIRRYTNSDVAKLSSESSQGHKYQRLTDSRLTGWAIWEWGPLDDFFVLTFGEGAFDRIAETYAKTRPCLANDPWIRSASRRIGSPTAIAQWYIALDKLRTNLGSITQDRAAKVTAALQAQNMTQDFWVVGREGRALTWSRCYRRDGQDVIHRYSDPARYGEQHRRIIPDQAENIAIVNVPTKWLIDNLPRAWLAAQSEGNLEKWQLIWNRLEEETGTDINGNLIAHLGNNVVIFDYPPHPLRIPFALTVAIEIDDRRAVAVATGSLLEAWSRYLDERAEKFKTTLVRLKVKKAEDGIWYLQAGILGPALKVTDHYLVISWSPPALREALKYIEGPQMRAAAP
jgi:hypothetical protein